MDKELLREVQHHSLIGFHVGDHQQPIYSNKVTSLTLINPTLFIWKMFHDLKLNLDFTTLFYLFVLSIVMSMPEKTNNA